MAYEGGGLCYKRKNLVLGNCVRDPKWDLFIKAGTKGKTCFYVMCHLYRVTHQVVTNLPLTSKQKFRFGLACHGLAKPRRNFSFDVNGRFVIT